MKSSFKMGQYAVLKKLKNKLKLYLKKRLGKTSLLFVRSWFCKAAAWA